jgi:catechol 2,3-dioxygenase-like lactoylglutathione lyase family enzyme
MGYHHLAVATRDLEATHRFYTEAMGFRLVKVVPGQTPEGGWSRHVFYDTGDGPLFAVWDIHDDSIPTEFETGLSKAAGLPTWVNHVAFDAKDRAGLEASRDRWLAYGRDVLLVDHEWCVSIYTEDPNGTLVEWSYSTREFRSEEIEEAEALLRDPKPKLESPPSLQVFRAKR